MDCNWRKQDRIQMEGNIMNDFSIFRILFCITLFLIGLIYGLVLGAKAVRQEVIDKGFGAWQTVNGTTQVEFKWKENK